MRIKLSAIGILRYQLRISTKLSAKSKFKQCIIKYYDFDFSVHKSKNHFDSCFYVASLLPLGAWLKLTL